MDTARFNLTAALALDVDVYLLVATYAHGCIRKVMSGGSASQW